MAVELSNLLRQLRESHGLNYGDVAFSIGVQVTDVIAWEAGTKTPDQSELNRLIDFYHRLENGENVWTGAKYHASDDPFDDKFYENRTTYTENPNTQQDTEGLLGKVRQFVTGDSSKMLVKPWTLIKTSLTHASFWVLIAGIIAFALCLGLTKEPLPTILLGSVPVPLFLVLFLYENNLYKDISLKDTLITFIVGGMLSIILTLVVDSSFRWSGLLLFVAIIEESAKAIIACRYIKKHRINRILSAMLIGACVGAGFAMLESMDYAYNFFTAEGYDSMREVIIVRAITEFGTHTIWASISAAAMVKISNGRRISYRTMLEPSFLKYFVIPVALHLLWNTVCTYLELTTPFLIAIALVGITVAILFLDMGVKEYNRDPLLR